MSEYADPIRLCIYCGDVMDEPTERQIEVFGMPTCCDYDMLKVERNKIYDILKGMTNLKAKLEQEITKGF
jgi:hypothetical protein